MILEPVTDMTVDLHESGDQPVFNLTWTKPKAGEVKVYRTEVAPSSSIGAEETDLSRLGMAKLAEDNLLLYRTVQVDATHAGLRNVPWPTDWTRAYFTPATILNGRAYVGRTVSKTRVGTVRDAMLRERVDNQVLTFAWPDGADSVGIYVRPRGVDTATLIEQPDFEVSGEEYRRQGGFRFPRPLVAIGTDVHLVPMSYEAGHAFRGDPTTLHYPGILKIYYHLSAKRNLMRNLTSVELSITADRENNSPPFVLVCLSGRFPLHIDDGVLLPVAPIGIETARPEHRFVPARLAPRSADPGWFVRQEDLSVLRGDGPYYLRLFADLPPEHLEQVAVIDPPITELRFGR